MDNNEIRLNILQAFLLKELFPPNKVKFADFSFSNIQIIFNENKTLQERIFRAQVIWKTYPWYKRGKGTIVDYQFYRENTAVVVIRMVRGTRTMAQKMIR